MPPGDGFGVKEIGESGIIGPYLANENLSLNLQENILLQPILIGSVVVLRQRSGSSPRVDKWNIAHALLVKRVYEVREALVGDLVVVDEVAVVLHVVDVGPHHI